jgi:hypothetical protein
MNLVLGGGLQIGDIIFRAGGIPDPIADTINFGRAVVAGMHHDAVDLEINGHIYSIGVDPGMCYEILRKGDNYQSIVFKTTDWLDEVQRAGFAVAPGPELALLWTAFSDEEQDEILQDARRCLIASGSLRGMV